MASSACPAGREVGRIIGESTPVTSSVIFSSDVMPEAGSYVMANTPKGCVFGVIEFVSAGNRLLPSSVESPESVAELVRELEEGRIRSLYFRGSVRWLSYLEDLQEGRPSLPKVPPPPGSPVVEAPEEVLERVFGSTGPGDGRGWVRLGSLLTSPKIEYRIDVNALTRHLAILAVTGGGKSNAVCVIARRIVGELGGTVVIFDMHGEYGDLGLGDKANVIERPGINPLQLNYSELLELADVPPNATNQQRAIRDAWATVMSMLNSGRLTLVPSRAGQVSYVIELLSEQLQRMADSDYNGAEGAYNRVRDLIDNYGEVLRDDVPLQLEKVIVPGKLNVFDLSSLDERAADAIVSHYLRRLLLAGKEAKRSPGRRYPVPAIAFVEEAHVLIPADRETLTKYWAARIAREGRKFGIGLVIVSQRPRNVDPNVLSQANNKIILRVVEPQDIKYVQETSEELSEDLAGLLPSLNKGEAVVFGSMVKLPAIVRIDYCKEKRGGRDVNLVEEWTRAARSERAEDLRDRLNEYL